MAHTVRLPKPTRAVFGVAEMKRREGISWLGGGGGYILIVYYLRTTKVHNLLNFTLFYCLVILPIFFLKHLMNAE